MTLENEGLHCPELAEECQKAYKFPGMNAWATKRGARRGEKVLQHKTKMPDKHPNCSGLIPSIQGVPQERDN